MITSRRFGNTRLVTARKSPLTAPLTELLLRLFGPKHVVAGEFIGIEGVLHTGSYQLAYDALRKSVAAIFQVQGFRPTGQGGRIAVQYAIRAQFPSVEEFKPFSRSDASRSDSYFDNM